MKNWNIIKEFKEFAIKGNMFDMAIGIIIGAAFSKIVSSMVKDIIMPMFGFAVGKVNFEDLKFVIQQETKDSAGNITKEFIAVNYGAFLQTAFDFLIITITIFIVIKIFNKLRSKAEDEKETSVPTPKDIKLLAEIRDLLKESNANPKK
ncbi:MAG: large conductance mechanosensitive channel protein MscL [Bacteroidetes bacterium]|nr:MAG: large conductance mechanosensitive channel protein MscL [Bacteroidota bacterium]